MNEIIIYPIHQKTMSDTTQMFQLMLSSGSTTATSAVSEKTSAATSTVPATSTDSKKNTNISNSTAMIEDHWYGWWW